MQCSWRGCGWILLKLFLFLPQGSHPNLSHPTKPQNNLTFYWNCYKVPSLTFSEVFFFIIPLGFTIPTYHEEKEILNTDRWPWEKKIPYFQTSYARRKNIVLLLEEFHSTGSEIWWADYHYQIKRDLKKSEFEIKAICMKATNLLVC